MADRELVVAAQPGDTTAAAVRDVVTALGARVVWYRPEDLPALPVLLSLDQFQVDGRAITAVLWRVSPEMNLGHGFEARDHAFAGAEVAATWVAGLRTTGVTAINRFDAAAWYSGLRPQYWRDRLAAAGVAVAAFRVGDDHLPADWQWSPYTTGEPCDLPEPEARAVMASACHPALPLATSAVVNGRVVAGPATTNVSRAARLLDGWGVGLAGIDSLADGRVSRVRVLPVFDDPSVRQQVSVELGRYLHDDCAPRRS